MSRIWNRVPQTVRPRSSGRAPLLLCLVAFSLTATVVYRWGRLNWTPTNPNPTYTATAYVVPRGANDEARIAMRHTNADGQRAAEAANAAAERYVGDRRAQWLRQTEGPCLSARAAAEKAQRDHAQDVARLETFRRQLAEEAEAAAKARLAARPRKPQVSPTTDNPQWLALNRQLAELEQRRDELLVNRTPLHPAAQDLAVRIAGLKDQLAATPRQTPRNQPDASATSELPSTVGKGAGGEGAATSDQVEEPASTQDALTLALSGHQPSVGQERGPQTRADQEKLDGLTAAVEKSAQALDDAESAVKKAQQEQDAGPQFAIERAQLVENPPPVDYGWRRLMWTTLLSSVLMAFGVGSMSVGAAIEPPVANIAEVQAEARVPVVGMIPTDDPLPDPTAIRRRQSLLRRVFVTIGLILIIICPVLAILGVIGISS